MKVKLLLILLLSVTTLQKVNSQNETEPNNSFSTANTISLTNNKGEIKGAISTSGDEDFYKVEITQPGVFDVTISNITNNMDMDLFIYDSSQSQIAFRGVNNSPNLTTSQLVCEVGTYYFKLSDDGSEFSNDLYNLKIELDTSDIYECNNSFSEASLIQLNQTVQGKIKNAGDEDFYKVEITQAGVFDVTISNITNNMDMDLFIYDSSQSQIAFRGVNNSPNLTTSQLVCEVGTYYFKLSDDGSEFSNDLYNLKIELDTSDIYECNNSFSEASLIQLNQTVQGKIKNAGDEDFYKVEITQAGVFDVTISNIVDIDMDLFIYDSSQNQIAFRGVNDSPNLTTSQLVCEVGTYYFKLSDDGSEFSNDLYNLKIELDTSDIYECNNSFSDATQIDLCEIYSGAIYNTGDKDYFSFNAEGSKAVGIQLSKVASNIRPVISIYNESQNRIDIKNGSTGVNLNFNFQPPSDAKYFLVIEEFGNNASNSQLYELLLEDSSCSLNTDNFVLDNAITIYPNPVTKNVNIQLNDGLIFQKVTIYNTLSQKIKSFTTKTIDVSNLAKGIYNIEITTDKGKSMKRFIKQ
jgi:preprotein translocase subunit SecB